MNSIMKITNLGDPPLNQSNPRPLLNDEELFQSQSLIRPSTYKVPEKKVNFTSIKYSKSNFQNLKYINKSWLKIDF